MTIKDIATPTDDTNDVRIYTLGAGEKYKMTACYVTEHVAPVAQSLTDYGYQAGGLEDALLLPLEQWTALVDKAFRWEDPLHEFVEAGEVSTTLVSYEPEEEEDGNCLAWWVAISFSDAGAFIDALLPTLADVSE